MTDYNLYLLAFFPALVILINFFVIRSIRNKLEAEHRLFLLQADKLRESEAKLATIIETEPECVKQLDRDGALLYMNRAGLEMIDAVDLAQVVGQKMAGLVKEEYKEAFKALNEKVFSGGRGSLVFEAVGLKGRHLWLETHAVPLRDSQDNIIALLGITRDITEQKRLEAEREKLIGELTLALENIRTLEGILPICASCKKIRDGQGNWSQVETYVAKHSKAEFTHGICPDCMKKLYPEFSEDES